MVQDRLEWFKTTEYVVNYSKLFKIVRIGLNWFQWLKELYIAIYFVKFKLNNNGSRLDSFYLISTCKKIVLSRSCCTSCNFLFWSVLNYVP